MSGMEEEPWMASLSGRINKENIMAVTQGKLEIFLECFIYLYKPLAPPCLSPILHHGVEIAKFLGLDILPQLIIVGSHTVQGKSDYSTLDGR